jgi:hypothetical protein
MPGSHSAARYKRQIRKPGTYIGKITDAEALRGTVQLAYDLYQESVGFLKEEQRRRSEEFLRPENIEHVKQEMTKWRKQLGWCER